MRISEQVTNMERDFQQMKNESSEIRALLLVKFSDKASPEYPNSGVCNSKDTTFKMLKDTLSHLVNR